jgi:hypothetical protein
MMQFGTKLTEDEIMPCYKKVFNSCILKQYLYATI